MFKIDGLSELQNKLSELANNARELDGQHSVPLPELLTPSFLSKHTRFLSDDDLFEAGGFKVKSTEDFEAIPSDKLDGFIRSESSFESWQAMLEAAGQEWAVKKLCL